MIYALIGHRGVGKTSLLNRIQKYRPDAIVFCLDERIEELYGPISVIFKEKGEHAFRKIEKDVFLKLMQDVEILPDDVYISVGAGFSEVLPEKVQIIWVRREIDASKLVFLNRPTLNNNRDNLSLPQEIYSKREKHYHNMCDEEVVLPEGEYNYLEEEKKFFTRTIKNCRGTLTLLSDFVNKPSFMSWFQTRDSWGLDSFEIRNDLLTTEQIKKIVGIRIRTPLLFAFRNSKNLQGDIAFAEQCAQVDWDMTLGEVPASLKSKAIVSLHSEENAFASDLEKIKSLKGSVKWSPIVIRWKELEAGHLWAMESPQTRTFLPRSNDGRWIWYRSYTKNKMMLHFFREGKGSAKDQPTLMQWLATNDKAIAQAAVIGAPIKHSWSPLFHGEFFSELDMNMFAMYLQKEDATEETLSFLQRLGFVAFAVTSPLKAWAQKLTGADNNVNTLVWPTGKKKWLGFSTDMLGLEQLLHRVALDLKSLDIAIWGSGAMAEEIQAKYPQATVYSARTALPVAENKAPPSSSPQVVIWAAGDVGVNELNTKYPHWKPIWVVDLNYRQDSPAISFAHKWGARYVSGADMFFGQAREQQKIWKKELK